MKSDLSAWQPYTDKFGLVQPDTTGGTSGNGIRFTCEAIAASSEASQNTAWWEAVLKCEQEPGLLQRFPGCMEQETGPDDYLPAASVSCLLENGALARRIYSYGKRHFGFFINGSFSWSAFLWRNPSLMVFTRYCALGDCGFLSVHILRAALKIAADSPEQDSKVLSWFMVRVLKLDKRKRFDKQIEYWKSKLREQYPRGIGNVLGEYFHPAHYDHPNSQELMDVFD